MNLRKINRCPICQTSDIERVAKIKSPLKEINNKFDLMKCKNCLHRFISKFPNQAMLTKLYKSDSPLVFGGTVNEIEQKKNL